MTRTADLEAHLARASDPELIPGIYNYCHRRCERCAFTGRCFLFRENQKEARRHGERGDEVQANLLQTMELIGATCERDGIDLEHVFADPDSEGLAVEQERLNDAAAAVERD